ncbi:hypothetical protein ABZY93_10250 [Streptomyces smyrnaeus]|uniref:hypothetical protein n=1 Tax=Streptomyces smyrnaeus TaxID=1387713 RepID=UPI0033AA89D3
MGGDDRAGGGAPQLAAELEGPGADPAAQLAAMAAYDRRLFERAGDIITLIREAGRTEPELAALYRDGRTRADETRVQVFSSWPADVLRRGLDVTSAADIYAAVCNIDVYAVLTAERGWSPGQVEQWWSGALARELLGRRPGAGDRRPRQPARFAYPAPGTR